MEPALISPVSVVLRERESLTPPGWDTNHYKFIPSREPHPTNNMLSLSKLFKPIQMFLSIV